MYAIKCASSSLRDMGETLSRAETPLLGWTGRAINAGFEASDCARKGFERVNGAKQTLLAKVGRKTSGKKVKPHARELETTTESVQPMTSVPADPAEVTANADLSNLDGHDEELLLGKLGYFEVVDPSASVEPPRYEQSYSTIKFCSGYKLNSWSEEPDNEVIAEKEADDDDDYDWRAVAFSSSGSSDAHNNGTSGETRSPSGSSSSATSSVEVEVEGERCAQRVLLPKTETKQLEVEEVTDDDAGNGDEGRNMLSGSVQESVDGGLLEAATVLPPSTTPTEQENDNMGRKVVVRKRITKQAYEIYTLNLQFHTEKKVTKIHSRMVVREKVLEYKEGELKKILRELKFWRKELARRKRNEKKWRKTFGATSKVKEALEQAAAALSDDSSRGESSFVSGDADLDDETGEAHALYMRVVFPLEELALDLYKEIAEAKYSQALDMKTLKAVKTFEAKMKVAKLRV